MLKQFLLGLLSCLLGAVFIFSAYTKIYPIEPFEFTFVDLGVANWRIAPFLARFFIGLEFFIGVLLLLNIKMKFSARLTMATLVFFSLYLIGIMAFYGNTGNCGCFGNYFTMTPLQALIKNVIMLALTWLIYKFHSGVDYKRFTNYILGIVLIASFVMPHVLNYVDLDYSQAYLDSPQDQFKLELDSLYKDAKVNVPPKDLSSGKRIIAFMSLTCPHCRIAAKKMRIIHERNPAIPMYFILNGEDAELKPFFEDTKTENIPWCMLLGRNFVYLAAGTNMPAIFLVNNSVVEHRIDYMNMDQSEIEKWLAE
ncbi:MAG: MauE/DoxX family redox-associated membrane protein [Bacteroidia bacterium]